MINQEFVSTAMNKISEIKEYGKYEEEDIIAYYSTHGTFVGIEEYLEKCCKKRS